MGAGWIASVHADAWEAACDRAQVAAVVDTDEQAAMRLASRFGARAFTSLDTLLQSRLVDAVDVCVPPGANLAVVTSAAQHGLHVMCEKPVGRTLDEVDEIARAIAASGVTYMPVHNTLFYPTMDRARQYVRQGDLGSVFTVRSWDCDTDLEPTRFGVALAQKSTGSIDPWRSSPQLAGGGALIDGGFHAVYRMLYLWPRPVKKVAAMMGQFHPELGWESEDTALLTIQFEGDSLGQVLISYAFDAPTTGRDRLFAVCGRDGVLAGDESGLELKFHKWDSPSIQKLGTKHGKQAWRETFHDQVDHFLDVLDGSVQPIQTIADARRSLEVIVGSLCIRSI